MMYLDRLLKGISDVPRVPMHIRSEITNEGGKIGWQLMHKRLSKIDSEFAKRISENDSQRITRGLEVWMYSGKNLTQWNNNENPESVQFRKNFKLKIIAILPRDRSNLHNRISYRFQKMIYYGLVQ